MSDIVVRLQRPTVASVCNTWNFDPQDGALMFLRLQDPAIRLPYKTQQPPPRRAKSAPPTAGGRCCSGGGTPVVGRSQRRRHRTATHVMMPMSVRRRITVDDLPFFDETRPHTGRSRRLALAAATGNTAAPPAAMAVPTAVTAVKALVFLSSKS